MNKEQEIKSRYNEYFNKVKKITGIELDKIRATAIEEFNTAKFPTKKNEEWKYTNINPLLKKHFIPVQLLTKPYESTGIIDAYNIPNLNAHTLVFINGIYNQKLSSVIELDEGIIIDSLHNLIVNKNPVITKLLKRENEKFSSENIFNFLNTAFFNDGLVLYIPKGKIIKKPVRILNIALAEENKPLIQPKNFIHLEENSQAKIIFEYVGSENAEYFTNATTTITAGANANLSLFKIQNESQTAFHIERTDIKQKNSSIVKHFALSFGAQISRNDINVNIDGENVENHLYGLYLVNKNQQIDNHTFIVHNQPNSESNQLYKGILDNEAKGIFSGKILVKKEAQKTNAFQSNKSVLLSEKAISNSKPQLEIYADDVKCTHGATVGKLDQEALFYIRSRGVPMELARSMLIRAFIDDVVKEITIEPLKEKVNHTIFQHLKRVEF